MPVETPDVAYERRLRLSAALYRIHRQSKFYTGTTPVGEAWLREGGTIGGEGGMPMDIGMNTFRCCMVCNHRSRPPRDEWPCETVKLLLEAGVIAPLNEVWDRLE